MKIDDFESDPDFPRKLLDKKAYVRLDPETGEPQLVRVEPLVLDTGELVLDSVVLLIDDNQRFVMERDVAAVFIEQQHCVPLEEFSDWKRKSPN